MRNDRFSYCGEEGNSYPVKDNVRKKRVTDLSRARRRSNRKRASTEKIIGIGHRRLRKWSW